MKEEVKVSIVQFNTEWLNLEKNVKRMKAFAEAEAKAGQELIVFPELANIGYITPVMPGGQMGMKNITYAQFASNYVRAAEKIPGPTTEAISAVTKKYGVYVVVGMAEKHPTIPGTLYNSGVFIGPEGVIGVHHKMHIPLNEKMFFYAGNEAEVFDTELGVIGVQVCYDSRFPELTRILALKGAEIICCPYCLPTGVGEVSPYDTLIHRAYQRANENMLFFVAANASGNQGDAHCVGHSVVTGPTGSILAASETDKEDVIRVILKEELLINTRSVLNVFRDRRPEMYDLLTAPLSEPYERPAVARQPRRVTRRKKYKD